MKTIKNLPIMGILLFFFSCLSPWEGDNGILTISVGTNSARSTLQDGTDKASLAYAITVIDSSGKTQSGTIQKGGGTFTFSPISLGLCTITVEGRQDGFPISEGTTSVEIKPGQNAASVTTNLIGFFEDFGAGAVISKTFRVSTTEAWNTAVSAISGGGDDKNYIISIQSDYTVEGVIGGATFGSATGIKVSLRGPGRTLTLSDASQGNLINIGANQTVILRNLTLEGTNSNISSLVGVSGDVDVIDDVYVYVYGIFTMQSGTISDNYGGGVSVWGGGTFTMNGGTISDNTANYGGGVTVSGSQSNGTKGTFTMNGGTISDNTANYGGGGVFVQEYGTFTMNGGTISDNTASNGGGVYVTDKFNMNGGKISGNTTTGDGGGVSMASGTFTMKGGEISGNTASTNGGGVHMNGNGETFRLVTGTIYGSGAGANSNTATTGMALYVENNCVAQSGTFDADGTEWYPQTPDLAITDDTIRVRNGVMQ